MNPYAALFGQALASVRPVYAALHARPSRLAYGLLNGLRTFRFYMKR